MKRDDLKLPEHRPQNGYSSTHFISLGLSSNANAAVRRLCWLTKSFLQLLNLVIFSIKNTELTNIE